MDVVKVISESGYFPNSGHSVRYCAYSRADNGKTYAVQTVVPNHFLWQFGWKHFDALVRNWLAVRVITRAVDLQKEELAPVKRLRVIDLIRGAGLTP